MPQTEHEVHSPHLTPRPGELWLHRDENERNTCEVEVVDPRNDGVSFHVQIKTKPKSPYAVGEYWFVDRWMLQPKPGEPYNDPAPADPAIIQALARVEASKDTRPNPNGRYPLCRPGIGPIAVRSCEVCGEPIGQNERPCPGIPRESRWGPDAEPESMPWEPGDPAIVRLPGHERHLKKVYLKERHADGPCGLPYWTLSDDRDGPPTTSALECDLRRPDNNDPIPAVRFDPREPEVVLSVAPLRTVEEPEALAGGIYPIRSAWDLRPIIDGLKVAALVVWIALGVVLAIRVYGSRDPFEPIHLGAPEPALQLTDPDPEIPPPARTLRPIVPPVGTEG